MNKLEQEWKRAFIAHIALKMALILPLFGIAIMLPIFGNMHLSAPSNFQVASCFGALTFLILTLSWLFYRSVEKGAVWPLTYLIIYLPLLLATMAFPLWVTGYFLKFKELFVPLAIYTTGLAANSCMLWKRSNLLKKWRIQNGS